MAHAPHVVSYSGTPIARLALNIERRCGVSNAPSSPPLLHYSSGSRGDNRVPFRDDSYIRSVRALASGLVALEAFAVAYLVNWIGNAPKGPSLRFSVSNFFNWSSVKVKPLIRRSCPSTSRVSSGPCPLGLACRPAFHIAAWRWSVPILSVVAANRSTTSTIRATSFAQPAHQHSSVPNGPVIRWRVAKAGTPIVSVAGGASEDVRISVESGLSIQT